MDKNGKTTIVLTRSGWILPKATFKRIEKQFIYIDSIAAWYNTQLDILMKSCSSSSFFLFCKETVSILILVPALSSFWHSTPDIPAEKSTISYIAKYIEKWRRRSMMYSKKIHGNIPIASWCPLTTTGVWVAITHGRRPEACAAAAAWTLFRLENLPNRSDHKNTPRSVDIGIGENIQQSQTAPSRTAQSSVQGSSWEHFRMALWCLCWFSLGLEEYRVSLISSLLHRSINEVARCFAISIREEASHNTLEPSGHRMLPGGRLRRDWSDILLCRLYIPGRPHLIGANSSHNICYRRTNFVFNEVTSQPSCHIWAKQRLCLMTIQHN